MPMAFVELDSKCYFLGGEFGVWSSPEGKDYKKALKECKKIHPTHPYSAKVYVFDPAKAKTTAKQQPLDASVLLGLQNHEAIFREVAPMTTGKHNLRAFIFDRKIYALGCSPFFEWVEFEYFEVYNPRINKRSVLPEPVWGDDGDLLTGHAVIDEKLYAFVQSRDRRYHQVYVFDLIKEKWLKQRRYSPECLNSVPYKYEFVDNFLYWCPQDQGRLMACGPISGETKLKKLFDNSVYILPDSRFNLYEGQPLVVGCFESLIHFGNQLICHVLSANPEAYPDEFQFGADTDTTYLRINICKPLLENPNPNPNTESSMFPFVNSECVYSAHFVVGTPWSNCGYICIVCFICKIPLTQLT